MNGDNSSSGSSAKPSGGIYSQYLPGRPLIFETVEDMEARIGEYFDYCDNRIQQVFSKKIGDVIEIVNPAPYTMAGLARALGMDRSTLQDYKARKDKNGKDYLPTIKKARDKVQEDVEQRLMEGQPAGAIFNLKNNFGYRDKTETEQSGVVEVITRKASKQKHDYRNENTPED
jgi:hypothetical protein